MGTRSAKDVHEMLASHSRALAPVPAAQLSIQLQANIPRKVVDDCQVVGP